MRQPIADRRDARCELGAVDQGSRAGVGQQVEKLFLDVAVAHVERRHPCPIAADHRLEVLVAVAQIDAEVVLSRFVSGQGGALGVAAESGRHEVIRETFDASVDLGVAEPTVAPHEERRIRNGVRDCPENGGQVEAHVTSHDTPGWSDPDNKGRPYIERSGVWPRGV